MQLLPTFVFVFQEEYKNEVGKKIMSVTPQEITNKRDKSSVQLSGKIIETRDKTFFPAIFKIIGILCEKQKCLISYFKGRK